MGVLVNVDYITSVGTLPRNILLGESLPDQILGAGLGAFVPSALAQCLRTLDRGVKKILTVLPDSVLLDAHQRDRLLAEINSLGSGVGSLQEPIQVLSRTEAMERSYAELSFNKRQPAHLIVGYLGFTEVNAFYRARGGEALRATIPLGMLDLLNRIRAACLSVDEECALSLQGICDRVLTHGGRIDTGGTFYSAAKDVVWFKGRVEASIREWMARLNYEDLGGVTICLFGPGALLLGRYFEAGLAFGQRSFPLHNPWLEFSTRCLHGLKRDANKQARKAELLSGRRWVLFKDKEVLNILDSLPHGGKGGFVEEAIRRFAGTDDGQHYLSRNR